ncbi:MAG: shikimate dehydrogenase [Cytophagales bacterium]|nr:shikimate dehydrogenase [Cytophagales bacterium]
MRTYGLIGFPLTHSFSKKYFSEKFEKEGIKNCKYELFEMRDPAQLVQLLRNDPSIAGVNVTIPHKLTVIPLLSVLDYSAKVVGAVNVIKVSNGQLIGYNSDYYGFGESLKRFLGKRIKGIHALILGTGGSSKAVEAALRGMKIPFQLVSRKPSNSAIAYSSLTKDYFREYELIINTTPLGMYPKVDECPPIPYEYLTEDHFLFDLVYNPEETLFLKKGAEMGAETQNGLEMLHLQAEKAWEIWNS